MSVITEGTGFRVVATATGEVVELLERVDALGEKVWRRLDVSNDGRRKIVGWKDMTTAAGLEPRQWRMLYKASRRSERRLTVQYDAFDQPWTYACVIRDWLLDCNRPAWAYDLEKRRNEQREALRGSEVQRGPKTAA